MPVNAVREVIRRWPGTIIFLLCVSLVATALFLDQRREAETCEDIAAGREVLQLLVIEATSGGSNLDFTRVPGFEDLEEQDQQFWTQVGLILASDDGNAAQRERLLATVPDIEC